MFSLVGVHANVIRHPVIVITLAAPRFSCNWAWHSPALRIERILFSVGSCPICYSQINSGLPCLIEMLPIQILDGRQECRYVPFRSFIKHRGWIWSHCEEIVSVLGVLNSGFPRGCKPAEFVMVRIDIHSQATYRTRGVGFGWQGSAADADCQADAGVSMVKIDVSIWR